MSCRILSALAPGVSLLAGWMSPALAQLGVIGGPTGPAIEGLPPQSGRPSALDERGKEEHALIAGDWLLYPTAFAGGMYDSNPNQSTEAQGSAGLRLVPAILAERTVAISKTSLYAMADGRLYADGDTRGFNALAARVGAIQDYEPVDSWVLHGQGDYTRQRDIFSTLGVAGNLSSLNPTGVGVVPTTEPVVYNQFTGTGSVLKRFSTAFASLGGSVVGIDYNQPSNTVPPPSGIIYTATGRGGVWVVPDVYAYVSGAVDARRWDTSSLNSNGFRTVAGLGSDQIGLLRGEIYGGYQQENFNSSTLNTVGSSVYGGRLEYFPYPKITLRAAADRTIGASLTGTGPATVDTASIVTSLLGQVNYAVFPEWEASGRGGYVRAAYIDSSQRDNGWTLGATLTYSVWRNLGLTFDYQHLALNSNVPDQGFTRDVVTFGISYKY